MEYWKSHVYEKTENKERMTISVRWVVTQKQKDGNVTCKARLVERGCEDENLKEIYGDSPTCFREYFRILLAIIITNKWKIHS